MRRIAVVLALFSSSIACGGFLGFGDDDAPPGPPPPVDDAGGDVVTAEGGSVEPPLPVGPGCTRHAMTFDGPSDVDAALATQGWDVFVRGTASLSIEDQRLVARSSGVGKELSDEANISFRHEGRIASITCKSKLELSTFDGQGRFFEARLFDTALWDPFWFAYGEWRPGMIGAAVQGNRVNDGGSIDVFPRVSAPPAATKLPLLIEITREPSRVHLKLGEAEIDHQPTSPGNPEVARVIFGAFTGAGAGTGPYELRYDAIDCVVCNVQ